MSRNRTPSRRAAAALCLAALVLLAGCSFGGGDGGADGDPTANGGDADDATPTAAPTPSPAGSDPSGASGADGTASDATTATPSAAATPTPTPTATSTATATPTPTPTATPTATPTPTPTPRPTLASLTTDQATALREAGSYTLRLDSRVSNATTTVVSEQTHAVDVEAGSAHLRQRQRLVGRSNVTLVTETYRADDVIFVRSPLPGTNTTIYERRSPSESGVGTGADTGNLSRPGDLAARFDFDHERTSDGDYRFTVDSPDQIEGNVTDGTVESVSVTVVVDDGTGLVTSVDYRLTATVDGDRVTVELERTLSGLGTTTVPGPDWLDEARERTGGEDDGNGGES